ncbi:MAG: hypothetical protein WKF55_08245 [Gemmatimonadaceae bacterium]
MRCHRAALPVFMIGLVGILGCVEPIQVTDETIRRDSQVLNEGTSERQALTVITRAVALALRDADFRNEIKLSMKGSV